MAGITANAWKEFTLSTAFNYTSGNLMVLVETNYGGSGQGSSAGPACRYTSATSKHLYVRADSSAPTGNGTVTSYRPNVKITITTAAKSPSRAAIENIESNMTVYPNPTSDIINLDIMNEQTVSVQIFNISGQKVMDVILDEFNSSINVSELSSGTYIVKMNDGTETYTDKFLKL